MLDDAALCKRKFDSDKMLDDVGRCWIIPEGVGGSLASIKCWTFLDDAG